MQSSDNKRHLGASSLQRLLLQSCGSCTCPLLSPSNSELSACTSCPSYLLLGRKALAAVTLPAGARSNCCCLSSQQNICHSLTTIATHMQHYASSLCMPRFLEPELGCRHQALASAKALTNSLNCKHRLHMVLVTHAETLVHCAERGTLWLITL